MVSHKIWGENYTVIYESQLSMNLSEPKTNTKDQLEPTTLDTDFHDTKEIYSSSL